MAYETKEVPDTRTVRVANICDRCGKRDEEYPKMWWFLAPGWVTLTWGSDPAYAKSRIICPDCSKTLGVDEL